MGSFKDGIFPDPNMQKSENINFQFAEKQTKRFNSGNK